MRLIGYFPGADFDSESQFGRQVHVYKFMEAVLDMDDVTSTFFVNSHGGQFPRENVRTAVTTGSFPVRLLHELWRSFLLIYAILRTDKPTIIYGRESPHFAPVVAAELTDASLVVEANDVPNDVREDADSYLQYLSLTGVRRAKWRRADRVIAVSDGVADYLRETHGVEAVTVVENGVDTDLFDCRGDVADGPPYTICYVGGLQPWQNIESMIACVAAMDTDVEFFVVGGESERRAHYEDVAAEYGVTDRVIFVGRVPHEGVPDYINRSDLCFGPFSEDRPASPLKIYEYLGCGREVVLVNSTGLEYLRDYPGVHYLDPADAETLADRVDAVLDEVELNRAGLERIHEERSWQTVAESVVSVCRSVTGAD